MPLFKMSVLNLTNPEIDIFDRPDVGSDPVFEEPPAPLKLFPEVSSNDIPVNNTDIPLVYCLSSLGKIKSRSGGEFVSLVQTEEPVQKEFLSIIQLYPAQYRGQVSPISNYSLHMVAGKLKDRYDETNKRFTRRRFLENDYTGIIAFEESQGNILVAFDQSWVLAALAGYIQNNESYQIDRPPALRENIATMQSIIEDSEIRWDNEPVLEGVEISLETLKIYHLHDSTFGSLSEIYMIFAPISVDEAEKIFLYLYRNAQLYSETVYLCIKDLSVASALDFQHLFPVNINYVGNYVIISTDKMTIDQLQRIWDFGEITFSMPRLNDLVGAYAAYLLAEATYYEYLICWENNKLYLGLCGYIQAQDLFEHFGRILNDIERESPFFKEIPNLSTAIYISQNTDIKCFYYNDKYYAVLDKNIDISSVEENIKNFSEVEMLTPLIAVTQPQTVNKAKSYLQLLGYDISPNPIPYENDIQLGYRTYTDGESTFTVYYYQSTQGIELEIQEIQGSHNENIKDQLQKLLNKGFFFTQKIKNITRGYPDFIPSDPPINPYLSKDPQVLSTQLKTLL